MLLKPDGTVIGNVLVFLQQVHIIRTLDIDPGLWDRMQEEKRKREEYYRNRNRKPKLHVVKDRGDGVYE